MKNKEFLLTLFTNILKSAIVMMFITVQYILLYFAMFGYATIRNGGGMIIFPYTMIPLFSDLYIIAIFVFAIFILIKIWHLDTLILNQYRKVKNVRA